MPLPCKYSNSIVTELSVVMERFSKHDQKAGIAAEYVVNFLGNGMQTSVSAARNINNFIPVVTNGKAEDNYLFDLLTYKIKFNREFEVSPRSAEG
jgi:hypothetical protein